MKIKTKDMPVPRNNHNHSPHLQETVNCFNKNRYTSQWQSSKRKGMIPLPPSVYIFLWDTSNFKINYQKCWPSLCSNALFISLSYYSRLLPSSPSSRVDLSRIDETPEQRARQHDENERTNLVYRTTIWMWKCLPPCALSNICIEVIISYNVQRQKSGELVQSFSWA